MYKRQLRCSARDLVTTSRSCANRMACKRHYVLMSTKPCMDTTLRFDVDKNVSLRNPDGVVRYARYPVRATLRKENQMACIRHHASTSTKTSRCAIRITCRRSALCTPSTSKRSVVMTPSGFGKSDVRLRFKSIVPWTPYGFMNYACCRRHPVSTTLRTGSVHTTLRLHAIWFALHDGTVDVEA